MLPRSTAISCSTAALGCDLIFSCAAFPSGGGNAPCTPPEEKQRIRGPTAKPYSGPRSYARGATRVPRKGDQTMTLPIRAYARGATPVLYAIVLMRAANPCIRARCAPVLSTPEASGPTCQSVHTREVRPDPFPFPMEQTLPIRAYARGATTRRRLRK